MNKIWFLTFNVSQHFSKQVLLLLLLLLPLLLLIKLLPLCHWQHESNSPRAFISLVMNLGDPTADALIGLRMIFLESCPTVKTMGTEWRGRGDAENYSAVRCKYWLCSRCSSGCSRLLEELASRMLREHTLDYPAEMSFIICIRRCLPSRA